MVGDACVLSGRDLFSVDTVPNERFKAVSDYNRPPDGGKNKQVMRRHWMKMDFYS